MFANYVDDIIKKYLDHFHIELQNKKFININDINIIQNNISDFIKNKSKIILKSIIVNINIFSEYLYPFLYLYLYLYVIYKNNNNGNVYLLLKIILI